MLTSTSRIFGAAALVIVAAANVAGAAASGRRQRPGHDQSGGRGVAQSFREPDCLIDGDHLGGLRRASRGSRSFHVLRRVRARNGRETMDCRREGAGWRLHRDRQRRSPEHRRARPLEPCSSKDSDRIVVLFRVVARSIERIRVVSADCVLDAGGRPLMWIEGVRPGDSVALLESLAVAPDGSTRVTDGAVMAIALHGDDSADTALDRLANIDRPETVRKKVTFWLGNARGRRGFDRLLADACARTRASRCERARSSACRRAR